MATERTAWQRYGWIARVLGTAGGIFYISRVVNIHDVTAAAHKLSIGTLALAMALVAANVVAGAQRWRVLLTAYGAQTRPDLFRATQLYFVSFFYNNYLPGAVVGDVVRGVVTRDVFGERGATAGLAVVFVERLLGLFGIFLLLGIGIAAVGSSIDTGWLWIASPIGIVGSFAVVLTLPFARRISRFLPAPFDRIAAKVPELSSISAFAGAAAYSFVTQFLIALAGYVLLHGIEPKVDLAASLLIVPLAAATTFLPITVGGAGAREAVYVNLGARLFGMAKADALAASLALWLAHLLVAAVGGIWQLVERRRSG